MICSRMFAGVDQSILRSTRNPLLNHEDSRWTTSRSSAASSLWPFIRPSRSARIATRSLVPPGARFSRRINSCRRGSEAKCRSLASSSLGCGAPAFDRLRELFPVRTEAACQRFEECEPLGLVEMTIAVENLARYRSAGGFASAREQGFAQFDQFGRIRFARMVPRGEAACGRARKSRRGGPRRRRCCSCQAISSRWAGNLHGI